MWVSLVQAAGDLKGRKWQRKGTTSLQPLRQGQVTFFFLHWIWIRILALHGCQLGRHRVELSHHPYRISRSPAQKLDNSAPIPVWADVYNESLFMYMHVQQTHVCAHIQPASASTHYPPVNLAKYGWKRIDHGRLCTEHIICSVMVHIMVFHYYFLPGTVWRLSHAIYTALSIRDHVRRTRVYKRMCVQSTQVWWQPYKVWECPRIWYL